MKIIKENHKNQLTLKDLKKMITALECAYGKRSEDIPIYLGDDDELNGIHCGWNIAFIPTKNEELDGEEEYRETISENYGNNELGDDEVAILIS